MKIVDAVTVTATVVLSLAVVGDIVHRWSATPAGAAANPVVAPAGKPRPQYTLGEPFQAIPGFLKEPGRAYLMMVVKDNCPFCSASMPFYRRLASDLKTGGRGVQLVAACPQTVAACAKYLESNEVPVAQTVSINPGQLKVVGTPTLILVDEAGKVESVWVGKLAEEKEAEVAHAIARRPETR